jgi:hypothetical protein
MNPDAIPLEETRNGMRSPRMNGPGDEERAIAGLAPLAAAQTKRPVDRIGVPADLEAHLRDEPRSAVRG